jgi:hypothetical protein
MRATLDAPACRRFRQLRRTLADFSVLARGAMVLCRSAGIRVTLRYLGIINHDDILFV